MILSLPAALAEMVGAAVVARLDAALERARQQQCAENERAAEAQRRQAALHELAQASNVHAEENANRTFLQHSVDRLLEKTLGAPVRARCLELQRKLQQSTGPVAGLVEEYTALLPLTHTHVDASPASGETALVHQAVAIEALLASPLLSASTTEECRGHLADMRALASSQPEVAAQGLEALERRVERALQGAAERLQAAEQVRALLDQALPKLQVICELSPVAADRERAQALRTALADMLAGEANLPAIQRIAEEAEALFAATRTALEGVATIQAVGEQIARALTHLGYQVTQIPGEAMLAPLDAEVGVEFKINATGHLETEMVALTPEAVAPDPTEQERVCSLVDQVVEALREQNCTVRERFRRHLTGEHPLRVVELPETAEAQPSARTTPKLQQEEMS
jgi:hypothetical protein